MPLSEFYTVDLLPGEEECIVQKRFDRYVVHDVFFSECEALQRLQHPCLPKSIKFATDDAGVTLSLSISSGETLESYANKIRNAFVEEQSHNENPGLSLYRVVWIARQLAETLRYLHNQRPFPVIHRNLSPQTLWITNQGALQLMDFGLSNSTYHFFEELTVSKKVEGTTFQHPELFMKRWTDVQCDLYSFGKILLYLMTSDLPSTEKTVSVPVSSNHRDYAIWTRLVEIAKNCYEPDETDGYQNAEDLVQTLSDVFAENPVSGGIKSKCECGKSNYPKSRFCARCGERLSVSQNPHADVGLVSNVPMNLVNVEQAEEQIRKNFNTENFVDLERFHFWNLLIQAQSNPGFDELRCLSSLPKIAKMEHQKQAVLRALGEMRGRALFADEVGLGKTVEAGIFLKELVQRKLVDNILIFCPGPLLSQWQTELNEKFEENFLILGYDIDTSLAWYCKRLLASYDSLHHKLHAEELLRHRFDLVILDEVHNLNYEKNASIVETVTNIQKNYFLLLSATPMHKSLEEIYNLVTLLRPGTFEGRKAFLEEFLSENERYVRNTAKLSALLRQVMIRKRRSDVVDYHFPRRVVSSRRLKASDDAVRLYQKIQTLLSEATKAIDGAESKGAVRDRISLIKRLGNLGQCLCSGQDAFLATLQELKNKDARSLQMLAPHLALLLEEAAETLNSLIEPKIEETKVSVRERTKQGDKILIFSEFAETARYIFHKLCQEHDLRERCFLYDFMQDMADRNLTLLKAKQKRGSILVCPNEAGEGLNLQFASGMINFDLPWDPMRLEQRIGRIQRIGGSSFITIVNLVLEGTVEEQVFEYCQDKIKVFEEVVGNVDEILGNFESEEQFQDLIRNVFLDRTTLDDSGNPASAVSNLDSNVERALAQADSPYRDLLNLIVEGSTAAEQIEIVRPHLVGEDDEVG